MVLPIQDIVPWTGRGAEPRLTPSSFDPIAMADLIGRRRLGMLEATIADKQRKKKDFLDYLKGLEPEAVSGAFADRQYQDMENYYSKANQLYEQRGGELKEKDWIDMYGWQNQATAQITTNKENYDRFMGDLQLASKEPEKYDLDYAKERAAEILKTGEYPGEMSILRMNPVNLYNHLQTSYGKMIDNIGDKIVQPDGSVVYEITAKDLNEAVAGMVGPGGDTYAMEYLQNLTSEERDEVYQRFNIQQYMDDNNLSGDAGENVAILANQFFGHRLRREEAPPPTRRPPTYITIRPAKPPTLVGAYEPGPLQTTAPVKEGYESPGGNITYARDNMNVQNATPITFDANYLGLFNAGQKKLASQLYGKNAYEFLEIKLTEGGTKPIAKEKIEMFGTTFDEGSPLTADVVNELIRRGETDKIADKFVWSANVNIKGIPQEKRYTYTPEVSKYAPEVERIEVGDPPEKYTVIEEDGRYYINFKGVGRIDLEKDEKGNYYFTDIEYVLKNALQKTVIIGKDKTAAHLGIQSQVRTGGLGEQYNDIPYGIQDFDVEAWKRSPGYIEGERPAEERKRVGWGAEVKEEEITPTGQTGGAY